VVVNGPNGGQHVFGKNSNGDLIHFYWSQQNGWAAENLTTGYANIGTSYRISGNPVVINGPNDGQHVFGRNINGDLIHYYWSRQAGWAAENLTTGYANIGTNFRISQDPVVVLGPGAAHHVFSRNSNGDLIQYYWFPQPGWAAENLTQYANIGTSFRIGANGNLTVVNGPGNSQHVYGSNSAKDLIHYYNTPQQGWAAENLTTRFANTGTFRVSDYGLGVINGPGTTHHVFALAPANLFSNADVVHFWAFGGPSIRSWHNDQDYRRWASGAIHDFDYEPENADDANATSIWGIPFAQDIVNMKCPVFDDNPASRAGTMLHEATHIIYYEGHQSVAPCPDDCADNWYSHGVLDYPWGTLDPDHHKHSMNQIKIEFLSDVSEFSESWVPFSVYGDACSDANQLMNGRIINPPGWMCGNPRPF
ncbi:MAG: hypothetical protein AB1489_32580, partial [Acidobacteriota bacterium]